jgi:hypothetical protein
MINQAMSKSIESPPGVVSPSLFFDSNDFHRDCGGLQSLNVDQKWITMSYFFIARARS